MDKVKKERYEQAVYLKMSMYLALEFLKNIPKDMQGDYVIGPHREIITYEDAVYVVESFADII